MTCYRCRKTNGRAPPNGAQPGTGDYYHHSMLYQHHARRSCLIQHSQIPFPAILVDEDTTVASNMHLTPSHFVVCAHCRLHPISGRVAVPDDGHGKVAANQVLVDVVQIDVVHSP